MSDPRTDAGAAERFARLHGDDVRYDHRRGFWLHWSGHRWTPDADGVITRRALAFARSWQRVAIESQATDREQVARFALHLEKRHAMMNMLAIARDLHPIADAGDHWDTHPLLLGTPNGVVDLTTGELRPGRRDDGITMATTVPFDAAATCARWQQFLLEVFDDDAAMVDFVHRATGYSLTGSTAEQVLFMLYGRGANGKGTFANTLKRVLGDYAWNMPFATVEMRDRSAIPNDLAALVGRRMVTAAETNDGTRLNEARIKTLTGEDPITARFLQQEYFEFEPVAKFWFSVNHKPRVKDDSFGFWRRIRLIPFTRTFAVNPTLGDELRAEGPGILTWAVAGALRWQVDGLQAPEAVTSATAEYEAESDPLRAFLEEATEPMEGSEVRAADLYDHYVQWAQRAGFRRADEVLTRTAFGTRAKDRLKSAKRSGGTVYLDVTRR